MLYLKVAAVITLIISLVVSPSAKNPNGTRDLLNSTSTANEEALAIQVSSKECIATINDGVHCTEKATHNGYCAQHFKD